MMIMPGIYALALHVNATTSQEAFEEKGVVSIMFEHELTWSAEMDNVGVWLYKRTLPHNRDKIMSYVAFVSYSESPSTWFIIPSLNSVHIRQANEALMIIPESKRITLNLLLIQATIELWSNRGKGPLPPHQP